MFLISEKIPSPRLRVLTVAALLPLCVSVLRAEELPALPEVFNSPYPSSIADLADVENHIAGLLERVAAATVRIDTNPGSATGVVVSRHGIVLTAAHSSKEPGRSLTVSFPDGERATTVSLGRNTALDAGLLRIEGDRTDWPHVEMGDMAGVSAGDWCLALGYPHGHDADGGPVPRIGRLLLASEFVLQSDCMVEWGDSGGPLFDMHGCVIGVHSFIHSDNRNFHVPISAYHHGWRRLIDAESFADGPRAVFEVSGTAIEAGLRLTDVSDELEQRGLQAGDILARFEGRPVPDLEQLDALIDDVRPQLVRLKVLRRNYLFTWDVVDLTLSCCVDWKEIDHTRIDETYRASWSDALQQMDDELAASLVRVRCDAGGEIRMVALGTVVDGDGWIVTKGSVLEGNIVCETESGTCMATYVGYHPDHDLALLKIDPTGLSPVEWEAGPGDVVGRCLLSVGVGVRDCVRDLPPVAPARIPFDLLGAAAREIPDRASLGVRLDQDADEALIASVRPESAGAQAGLEVGDILVDVDGKSVTNHEEVVAELERHDPGDEVALTILRDQKEMDITATLMRLSHITSHDRENIGPISDRGAGFACVFRHATVIYPEECGGPVVGLDGRVVGINIARAGRTATYAIPAHVIQSILPAMQAGEYAPTSD